MNRIRKFSTKVFQKDSPPAKPSEKYSGPKPVHREKPIKISDIYPFLDISPKNAPQEPDRYRYAHGHSHPEDDYTIDKNVVDSFPLPPVFNNSLSTPVHSRSITADDLLPPLPQKVQDLIERNKQRERTHSPNARSERYGISAATPLDITMTSYQLPSNRRPLHASSHSNMSSRSLGPSARLKAGPIAQRAVVQQASAVPQPYSVPQSASWAYSTGRPTATRPSVPATRPPPLYSMPEGERRRLRSNPVQDRSTIQGHPRRRI
ncbi:hypothetical protein C8J57DRAFT_590464 [Mycena rebaudengoi]|nr:hypothetical protein C8J57DRAFT_590464 [Mycena rebaudengoi]